MSDCQCLGHQLLRLVDAIEPASEPTPEPVAPEVDDQDNTETDPAFATVSITISGAPILVAGTINRLRLT